MWDFDYGNARLRAMKTRLLSHKHIEELASLESVGDLLSALTATPYQHEIDAALVRTGSLAALSRALSDSLVDTGQRVRTYYDGRAERQIRLWLRIYDVRNVKAVLRGVAAGAPPADIERALLPIGDLSMRYLQDLSHEPSIGAVIDSLATRGQALARPLVHARAEHGTDSVVPLEVALDCWLFEHAQAELQAIRDSRRLAEAIAIEADIVNLLTVLHIVGTAAPLDRWRAQLGVDALSDVFVPGGHVSQQRLAQAAEEDTLPAAIEMVSGTPYGDVLEAALPTVTRSGQLAHLEAALVRYRLRWLVGQMREDPLGIGVPLGYLALKTAEVRNLRWIAYAVYAGLSQAQIRDGLEFAL